MTAGAITLAVPEAMLAHPDRFGGAVWQGHRVGHPIIAGGTITGLQPSDNAPTHLLMTALTEPHVHLDKCHSIDRISIAGGDLSEAIDAQSRDRALWTEADLSARAGRGLDEALAASVDRVRSHIDWGEGDDPLAAPLAWHVLGELAQDRPGLTLQRAALISVEALADRAAAEPLARLLAHEGGVLGAFVLGQPMLKSGIETAFHLAERFGLALDFHVDETLDPAMSGMEAIVDTALAMRHQGPVICGHFCNLPMKDRDEHARLIDKIAASGIAIAALPATNLFLQGRGPQAAGVRGLTDIAALREAGVRVTIGADNVRDAFCPVGALDPSHTLGLAALAAHLPLPLTKQVGLIANDASIAIGMSPRFVDTEPLTALRLFRAASVTEWVSSACPVAPMSELMGEPA